MHCSWLEQRSIHLFHHVHCTPGWNRFLHFEDKTLDGRCAFFQFCWFAKLVKTSAPLHLQESKSHTKKGSIWLPLYPVYMSINPHIPNIRQIDESVGFCSPTVFCHKALGTEISDAASAAPTAALFRKDSSQWGLFILIRGAGSKRCGKSGGRGDDRNNQQHTYESKSNLKIL